MMRPVAVRDHARSKGLRHEEGAAQIRVKHKIPIVPRHVDRRLANIASGVVDQDVDRGDGSQQLARPSSGCSRDRGRRVPGQAQRPAQRFDLGLKRDGGSATRRLVTMRSAPARGERARKDLPQTAAGAG